jgi:DHA1 family tetracycline resistance protein-like MFS transporter
MDRRLVTILLIVLVQMLGAAMILPILPLYAQKEYNLSPQVITLLSTSFFAAQFLAGPYLGRLSDKFGRVPVLIISQIGTAISFVMLALAPSAAFLYLARILDGITGGNIIVAQAYVTDITPREKRTESLGYIFAVFGLGFILGPALGGVLSAAFGPRVPYLIAAGAAFAVVLLTWFTLEETLTPEQREANRQATGTSISPSDVIRNRPLVLLLIVAFLGQSGLGLLQSTFALYGEAVLFEGYSPQAAMFGIGLLLATFGLSQFISQVFFLRPMLARFGEYRLIILGNIGRMIGSFTFALVTTPLLGAASSVIFAIGISLMMPSLQSLATGTVDDEFRGGVLGLYQSTISLSIIISSAVAGVLFAISATMPYWISGVLAALALVPAFVLMAQFGQKKPSAETRSAPAD